MMPPVLYLGTPLPAPTWRQKLNPLWWLDDEFRPTNASKWAWAWRQKQPPNFCQFVVGVQDRNHTFAGSKNSNGIFATGWQIGVVRCGWLRLPLVSYRGTRVECYLGWRPIGALGWAFRKANATTWTNP